MGARCDSKIENNETHCESKSEKNEEGREIAWQLTDNQAQFIEDIDMYGSLSLTLSLIAHELTSICMIWLELMLPS